MLPIVFDDDDGGDTWPVDADFLSASDSHSHFQAQAQLQIQRHLWIQLCVSQVDSSMVFYCASGIFTVLQITHSLFTSPLRL